MVHLNESRFVPSKRHEPLYSVSVTDIAKERNLVNLMPLINSIVDTDIEMKHHYSYVTPDQLYPSERLPRVVRRNMTLADAKKFVVALAEAGAKAMIEPTT